MKMTLISPCYFCLWMAASYTKILKSSANFTNVVSEEPMKAHQWLLLFYDHF